MNNFDQNDNRPKLLFILYIQACLYFFSKVQSLYLFLTFTRIIWTFVRQDIIYSSVRIVSVYLALNVQYSL